MYIRHITLTSGHTRDCYPSEVGPAALAALAPALDAITTGETSRSVPVPGQPGYSLSGRGAGRCLVITVWRDGPPSECICSIGIALHSRCGASLWRGLHQWGTAPVVTDPEQCPPEPWVAAALELPALRTPDALHWLGDLERCLAWAWAARQERPT